MELSLLSFVIRIVMAAVLGGLIGLERGKLGRAAGMRTHILVCMGAAITAIVGLYTSVVLGSGGDPMRISAQVVSGIGFLGAGTILVKDGPKITGLTTAAGLWTTATIGLMTGVGLYVEAGVSTVIVLIAVIILSPLEHGKREREPAYKLYAELYTADSLQALIETMETGSDCEIDIVPAKSGLANRIGVYVTPAFHCGEETYAMLRRERSVALVLHCSGARRPQRKNSGTSAG